MNSDQINILCFILIIYIFTLNSLDSVNGGGGINSGAIDKSLNLISDFIDVVCTKTLPFHAALQLEKPDIKNMYFRHITHCRNFSVPLVKAKNLIKHKLFDRRKKIIILATGWRNTVNNSKTLNDMSKAFLCRNDVNFLFADVGTYMATNYKWAAINTKEVGELIALGLRNLIEVVPLKNIHLIGFSLGAHVMASAGRSFIKLTNGLRIPRITGLDPAKPCFGDANRNAIESEDVIRLRKGDAQLVDVIHTNTGFLGVRYPVGDIDFYPGGAKSIQPGCNQIDCSHPRAAQYFIESVYPRQERNFPTYKCQTFKQLEAMNCSLKKSKLYMGYKLVNRNFGIFYVDVNERAPFGKNSAAAAKTNLKHFCRRRRRVCRRRQI